MRLNEITIRARHAGRAALGMFGPAAVAAGILALALCSCSKERVSAVQQPLPGQAGEIIFRSAEAMDLSTRTAPTPVTELTSFHVAAVRDVESVETAVWSVESSLSGTYYTTDRFWPITDLGYRFYASNLPMTQDAAGATVTVDCSADAVCAYLPSPTYKEPNTLAFGHILARVGDISLDAPSGYTISGVTLTLSAPVTGTYNLKTGAWSALGSASVLSATSGSNDLWCVPGTATLSAVFTLTKGDFTKEYAETASVTLPAGKVSAVTAHIVDDDAVGITFIASVTPWGAAATDITIQ